MQILQDQGPFVRLLLLRHINSVSMLTGHDLSFIFSLCLVVDRLHVTSLPPCWKTITKDSSLASIVSSPNMAATSLWFESVGIDCKPSIRLSLLVGQVRPFVSQYNQSVSQSIISSVSQSVSHTYLSIHPSIHPSIRPSVHRSINLSIDVFPPIRCVSSSLCPSVCASLCSSVKHYTLVTCDSLYRWREENYWPIWRKPTITKWIADRLGRCVISKETLVTECLICIINPDTRTEMTSYH